MKPRPTPIVNNEGDQFTIRELAVVTKVVKLFVLMVFFLSVSSSLNAQEGDGAAADAPPPPAVKPAEKNTGEKKKTNIDFEDELVEGELKKPELFYLLQKKQFNFKRLIKLRENFLPEMRRDADEIRRGRSKN